MRYLYTTEPDDGCHKVSSGIYGRPVHRYEEKGLREKGWKVRPDDLRQETQAVSTNLVDEYVELFGKKPHHKMRPETIQAKIDEALSDD